MQKIMFKRCKKSILRDAKDQTQRCKNSSSRDLNLRCGKFKTQEMQKNH